jgi:hypothetical protein
VYGELGLDEHGPERCGRRVLIRSVKIGTGVLDVVAMRSDEMRQER